MSIEQDIEIDNLCNHISKIFRRDLSHDEVNRIETYILNKKPNTTTNQEELRFRVEHEKDGVVDLSLTKNVIYTKAYLPDIRVALEVLVGEFIETLVREAEKVTKKDLSGSEKLHKPGDNCDICNGTGVDYIGRPCRLAGWLTSIKEK